MPTALVFGGSGQIGEPVLARLRDRGWRAIAVSRQPRAASEALEWREGTLQSPPELPTRVDAIFSLGPLDHFATWHALGSVAAPRVVAFGSTSVAVKQDSADAHERDLAARLRSAEAALAQTTTASGAALTVLRPTLVYGSGRDRSLSSIVAIARRSGWIPLPGNARGLRQPVHVDDLADAALAVLDAPATFGVRYDLPGGETLPYSEMVARTLAAMDPPARVLRVPTPLFKAALTAAHAIGRMQALGDQAVRRMAQDVVFDAAPARRDFGYAPRAFEPGASIAGR